MREPKRLRIDFCIDFLAVFLTMLALFWNPLGLPLGTTIAKNGVMLSKRLGLGANCAPKAPKDATRPLQFTKMEPILLPKTFKNDPKRVRSGPQSSPKCNKKRATQGPQTSQ